MANFGTIYNYQSKNGIVVPDTSSIKATITSAMKTIFGSTLDTTDETPMGRLIEALTLLMIDCIGVNAQNVNEYNPSVSVGTYLDNLGAIFGITRLTDETDASLRKRIVNSQSRGSGFSESIRQAISNVSGVTSVVVIDNPLGYPQMLPSASNGVCVPAHSVFICVGGWTTGSTTAEVNLRNAIAKAIVSSKSAGCGYCADTVYGTPASVTVEDEDTGSQNVAIFYAPVSIVPTIIVTVDGDNYTGTDIQTDTKNIIVELFENRNVNSVTTNTQIAAAINTAGLGLSCTNVTTTVDGVSVTEVNVKPYQVASVSASNITVNVL